MRTVRSRLTYANVMSTLAVFLALAGGVAWALGRNDVKSRHIAPNEVRAADISDALRLECPGATRYFEGACFETAARAPATFTTARNDCLDDRRRLPAVTELMSFRLEPGITLGEGGDDVEWTVDLDQNSAGVRVVADNGQIGDASMNDAQDYRCVTRAKR